MGTLGILSFVLMAMAGGGSHCSIGTNYYGCWCCYEGGGSLVLSGYTAPLPEDVPAVQEEQEYEDHLAPLENCKSEHVEGTQASNVQVCEYHKTKQLVWTCPDPHAYALLTSVDGQVKVCHRISR